MQRGLPRARSKAQRSKASTRPDPETRARPAQGQWAAARSRCPPRASTRPKGARQGRARLSSATNVKMGVLAHKVQPAELRLERSGLFQESRVACQSMASIAHHCWNGNSGGSKRVKHHEMTNDPKVLKLQLQTSHIIIYRYTHVFIILPVMVPNYPYVSGGGFHYQTGMSAFLGPSALGIVEKGHVESCQSWQAQNLKLLRLKVLNRSMFHRKHLLVSLSCNHVHIDLNSMNAKSKCVPASSPLSGWSLSIEAP